MSQSPIDRLLDGVAWQELAAPTEDADTPHATREGVLDIGGFQFRVYQLSDGQRIIHAEDVERFFGFVACPAEGESAP